jgi:hypothetical protein
VHAIGSFRIEPKKKKDAAERLHKSLETALEGLFAHICPNTTVACPACDGKRYADGKMALVRTFIAEKIWNRVRIGEVSFRGRSIQW